MAWLDSTHVLTLAGYPTGHLLSVEAIMCAERMIEDFTRSAFGSVETSLVRHQLYAKSYSLPLPIGVVPGSAVAVNPTPANSTIRVTPRLIWADDNAGQIVIFEPATYEIMCQRGYAVVPDDVYKAASLIIGWYISISDPDRSRYGNLQQGDFGGSMRMGELPVPEAAQLLKKYRNTALVSA